MAFRLQPREQAALGIGAIAAVVIFGLWGVVWDFAIIPKFETFQQAQMQLTGAKSTEAQNDATLMQLNQDKVSYDQVKEEIPENKEIGKVNAAEGGTLENTKRDLMNTVIEMSQNTHKNILISVKPLPKPAPPPKPINPNPDPNAPPVAPEMTLSDFIEELPYEIKLRGNYTSLNDFVNELADFDTVIEISRAEITPDKETKVAMKDPARPLEAKFLFNFLIQK